MAPMDVNAVLSTRKRHIISFVEQWKHFNILEMYFIIPPATRTDIFMKLYTAQGSYGENTYNERITICTITCFKCEVWVKRTTLQKYGVRPVHEHLEDKTIQLHVIISACLLAFGRPCIADLNSRPIVHELLRLTETLGHSPAVRLYMLLVIT